MKLTGDIRCDFEKVTAENVKLKDRIPGYQETISGLRYSLNAAQKSKDRQPGHEKHILTPPADSQITQTAEHGDGGDGFACPDCCSENFEPAGESETEYEYDIEVKAVRCGHIYYYYRCLDCGTQFRSVIEPRLKEKCQ